MTNIFIYAGQSWWKPKQMKTGNFTHPIGKKLELSLIISENWQVISLL